MSKSKYFALLLIRKISVDPYNTEQHSYTDFCYYAVSC